MSDLISRKALIRHFTCDGYIPKFIKEAIEVQPVAYDVDKVVEQLEEFRAELKQFGADGILTDMLEVVRAGGKE